MVDLERLLQAQAVSNTWLLLGVGLGLALLVAVALLNWLVRQWQVKTALRALLIATQRIAAGHFEVDLNLQRHDEIGRLAVSMTQMADKLQATFINLEHKITELEKIQDASRLLASVVESSNDAIITKTLQGTITSWNATAEKMFGYSEAEAIGRNILMLFPPDRVSEELHIVSCLKQGNLIEHFETIRLHKDGTPIEISVTISPLRNNDGEVLGASKIVRDIRDRNQNQDAIIRKSQELEQALETSHAVQLQLQASELFLQRQTTALFKLTQNPAISGGKIEEAFRALTEAAAELIDVERVSLWLADADYTKIQCVDLFEQMTMRHSHGLELCEADYPIYFDAVRSTPILAAHDAMQDPRTCEFRKGYLDIFNIVSMLDCCIYINGKIQGIICCEQIGEPRTWTPSEEIFIRSITNLAALTLEAAQRQDNALELEQALADLRQTQLNMVQSEKMASLGNLVAGVAHEINNPVGFLKGNIKPAQDYISDLFALIDFLLQKYPSDALEIQDKLEELDFEFIHEDLPKLLQSMDLGVERIRTISDSLRTFARKDQDHKTEFNIHDGLNSTLLILKHRMKGDEKRPAIAIIKKYDELPKICCFPGQLNQVFVNLLANAIDAFEEANRGKSFAELETEPNSITIETHKLDEQQIQVRIQDNGCGMSPEIVERAFEQGFTTKTVGKGTGLGMAIAHQIVTEKHNGSITCYSKLGQGTIFTITLPL